MPCVAAERLFVALQQFDLAVYGKHLLHKCAPKMQQSHGERRFILSAKRLPFRFEELAEIRPQCDRLRRLATAGGASLYQNPVGNFAGTTEALLKGEAIISAEPADGLALFCLKGESGML